MAKIKMRGYLFTAIFLVTFITIGMPTSSIARQISFAPNRNIRAVESRIEIGGAIHNLPNYQTPESCEDMEIKYTDVKSNSSSTPNLTKNITAPKSIASNPSTPNNRCRYLLQVPRSMAGKQISISISPVDRPQSTRSVVFVVPSNISGNRAIAGPTFEF